MMICRNHHERPGRYIKLLRQLINGEGLDAGAFEIRDYEKQRVADWLNGEIYSPRSNKICKYVLLRLDSIFAKESGVSYNPKIISIEHVLPQNPKPNSDWMQNFTEEQREYWTHRLGNLLLLNWRTNSSAGNQDFEIKKEKFFKRKISDSIICSHNPGDSRTRVDTRHCRSPAQDATGCTAPGVGILESIYFGYGR